MGRTPCCDKASVKKGPWSPEEDKQLKEYIEKHGTGGNWIALPHKAGLKRCGKSCRLRWLNYLRPNIKHGDFSDDEDRIICNLYASIGSRWSIIASQLPGRTDNDIKNYWNTKLKKKLLAIPPPQRKPHEQYHKQHQQQQFQSSFQTTAADPFSLSPGLEGIPISPYLLNSLTSTASAPLLQGSVLHQNSSRIMLGGQQSCSSSDGRSSRISYANDTDQDLYHRAEQMGFESYLCDGLEEMQKMLLGGGETSMGFTAGEVKPVIVSANTGCNSLILDDSNSSTREVSLRAPARSMYFY